MTETVALFVCFQMSKKGFRLFNILSEKLVLFQKLRYCKAISHNDLRITYYQQLSITRYQVKFKC